MARSCTKLDGRLSAVHPIAAAIVRYRCHGRRSGGVGGRAGRVDSTGRAVHEHRAIRDQDQAGGNACRPNGRAARVHDAAHTGRCRLLRPVAQPGAELLVLRPGRQLAGQHRRGSSPRARRRSRPLRPSGRRSRHPGDGRKRFSHARLVGALWVEDALVTPLHGRTTLHRSGAQLPISARISVSRRQAKDLLSSPPTLRRLAESRLLQRAATQTTRSRAASTHV